VGGGDIEGAIVKNGGLGFEGLDLELLDASGKVVGTTRTDFDGYFLFERVAYGTYTVRVAKSSAETAKIATDLGINVQVSAERAVVRLGSIRVAPQPHLADASAAPAEASFR
jgi:hypothetical protein